MLTKTDVKRELDLAGFGPVILIRDAAAFLSITKYSVYAMIADGRLIKAGVGVISRDSLESLILANPKYFAEIYAQHSGAGAGKAAANG